MAREFAWESDERCVAGNSTFQILPADLLTREHPQISMEGADFLLFKEPALIDHHVAVLSGLRPRNVVELGVMEGGGTALLSELVAPRRLVAIDRRPPMSPNLRDYVSRAGLEDVVRIYDDADQADRARLAAIVSEEFGDEPLDFVLDDCSHLYGPTRASFNELFPRLRPGGIYTIEDWRWAHALLDDESHEGLWPDEVPLTRLVFELVLALASVPDLIADITVENEFVQLTRGKADVDRSSFDISTCSRPRGRALIAPDERVDDRAGVPGD
jgi:SAM-dependent methyltransferase